jgi:hypothetical protein
LKNETDEKEREFRELLRSKVKEFGGDFTEKLHELIE